MTRSLIIVCALLIAMALPASYAKAADTASVSVTLIQASSSGSTAASLRGMEAQLKRIFNFSSYSVAGRGTASVAVPGSGSVSLGGGHSVTVSPKGRSGGRLSYGIQWRKGGSVLVNSTVTRRPGETVLLGGPAQGGGRLILNISVR